MAPSDTISIGKVHAGEVHVLRDAAADALYPDIDTRKIGGSGNGVIRHYHHRGKRLLIAVACPIEIRLKNDLVGIGTRRLRSGGEGAFERRAGYQRRGIPADTLIGKARAWVIWIDAHAQRSLRDRVDAREATARLDITRGGVECAAAGQEHDAVREAFDCAVEAEPHSLSCKCRRSRRRRHRAVFAGWRRRDWRG